MRILVVEDDPPTLEMLTSHLEQWEHVVIPCSDGEAAWSAIEDGEVPQLAILDWMMPGMDGLELCSKIRNRPGPYIYIIMVTARTRPEDLLAGFEAGADDYLTKPFSPDELIARLRAGGRIVDLQSELIEARDAIRAQSMQDPLTRVLNHGAIVDALSREIDRSHREHKPLSVIMADLDEFKRINDSYGHVAGDRVLIEVAQRMRRSLRSYDSLGRYGGEEFLIVLPNSGQSHALSSAERLRHVVSGEPFRIGRATMTVTLSLGVSTWSEPYPVPMDGLIQAADRALYLVKGRGRNGVEYSAFEAGDRLEPTPPPAA
jgi:diguanylate cyclase (GGDEF)-like protein